MTDTKEPITPEQRERLFRAIERAEGPGECSYLAGCVVAQLAAQERTKTALVALVKERPTRDSDTVGVLLDHHPLPLARLRGYPRSLLVALQVDWDADRSPEIARRLMRDRVAAWPVRGA